MRVPEPFRDATGAGLKVIAAYDFPGCREAVELPRRGQTAHTSQAPMRKANSNKQNAAKQRT